ncbi:MAG: hypothetical protein LBM93_14215, partial [Oscillospiraceae bacterium]|nr:hypothetical protein [Oscillospiraceae bacterium]
MNYWYLYPLKRLLNMLENIGLDINKETFFDKDFSEITMNNVEYISNKLKKLFSKNGMLYKTWEQVYLACLRGEKAVFFDLQNIQNVWGWYVDYEDSCKFYGGTFKFINTNPEYYIANVYCYCKTKSGRKRIFPCPRIMNPKSAKMLAKVFCDKNKNLYL